MKYHNSRKSVACVIRSQDICQCRQSGCATREIPSTHHLVATSVLQAWGEDWIFDAHSISWDTRLDGHQRGRTAIFGRYRFILPNITNWVMTHDDCRSEDVEGRRQDMSPVGCLRILSYIILLQQDQTSAPVPGLTSALGSMLVTLVSPDELQHVFLAKA
ncbi:hypothetical protein EDD18DRAFT_1115222 [Armillaria luteobubalina]|uniref:Uncharacterized protein n=1 Tax=Armillaria luteobubalina TaxID=153913 RepID=A0AA39P421_9AGAR|nr:hypothetical protein EDD18DRAFT_1115222 [Armillaria luteobubalina]